MSGASAFIATTKHLRRDFLPSHSALRLDLSSRPILAGEVEISEP